MYAVVYGDMENGENIEVEGLFQTHEEAVKALYESASKTFNSLNIDIESCVDDKYDWSPRGEIHKESAWANSGGEEGYPMFCNIIMIDDHAFNSELLRLNTSYLKS